MGGLCLLCQQPAVVHRSQWRRLVSSVDENNEELVGAMWKEGSDEIEGYKNLGDTYTIALEDGVSITFDQNVPASMTETVLTEDDWESQMKDTKSTKEGREGNCFHKSGDMVKKSGATSIEDKDGHNITSHSEMVSYLDDQVNNDKSARVHVDRDRNKKGGDEAGDHWVAISSRTTNLRTQTTTSYGFYDLGTFWPAKGTNATNQLNNKGSSLTGSFGSKSYLVKKVRKNK